MPQDYCTYPNYVVLRRVSIPTDESETTFITTEYRYYFSSKTILEQGTGYSSDQKEEFIVDTNTILDVTQSGTLTTVYVYSVIVAGTSLSILKTNYVNRRLLTAKIVAGSPVPDFVIKMFNTITKAEETVSSPTVVPCFDDFIFGQGLGGVSLSIQCIAFDRRSYTWLPDTEEIIITTVVNSPSCGYVVPVVNTPVTEIKRIKIITDCVKNPVMLVWKNSKGGWDRWLFGEVQTISRNTESAGRVEQPYFDLLTVESMEKDMGKTQTNFMKLGAQNLSRSEKNGIEKLMIASKVYMLTKNGNSFRKQYVKVLPNKWVSEETNAGSFDIEFEIELPETFAIQ